MKQDIIDLTNSLIRFDFITSKHIAKIKKCVNFRKKVKFINILDPIEFFSLLLLKESIVNYGPLDKDYISENLKVIYANSPITPGYEELEDNKIKCIRPALVDLKENAVVVIERITTKKDIDGVNIQTSYTVCVYTPESIN